ncbi:MAG: RNA-binding protein [Deltaproteobacteria bacterium]|nr:RNA-binding protein [Deltaproteobacteria bacterium]
MKIYVGNLSYEANESDLKEQFSAFGEVDSVSIIKDKYSGQSRGFAFVEMSDNTAAQAAITALNDKELKGRNMSINEARPQTDRGAGGRGGFSSGRRGPGGGGGGRGGSGGGRGGSGSGSGYGGRR